jgi:hypothetical protein
MKGIHVATVIAFILGVIAARMNLLGVGGRRG